MYWKTGAQSARCTTLREWQLRAPSVTKQPGYPEKAEEKNKGKDLFLLSHGAHWEVGSILTCGSPMPMVVVFCPTFRWGSAVQLLKQEMDSEFVFDAELKWESRKLLTRFFGSRGGGVSKGKGSGHFSTESRMSKKRCWAQEYLLPHLKRMKNSPVPCQKPGLSCQTLSLFAMTGLLMAQLHSL